MDIEKLIERLEEWNEQHLSVVCGDGHFACDYLCENEDCIVVRATTALSTLQAENEKLRDEVERQRRSADNKQHLYENAERAYMKVLAELEQVKRERDAAVKDLNEFLSMDELCPIQCEWCKWNGTYCDGKSLNGAVLRRTDNGTSNIERLRKV